MCVYLAVFACVRPYLCVRVRAWAGEGGTAAHQVPLHGLEVAGEAGGAGGEAGDGGQPPRPDGPVHAVLHHTPPGPGPAIAPAGGCGAAGGLGGAAGRVRVGAEVEEGGGADGGGEPVEHAGEELGGERRGEVAAGDAGEGHWPRVGAAAVAWRQGRQGDEDVAEEKQVAEEVREEDLGLKAGKAERQAVGERPGLVREREEHDRLPSADVLGFWVQSLRCQPAIFGGLWQTEVHFSQSSSLKLGFFSSYFLLWRDENRSRIQWSND